MRTSVSLKLIVLPCVACLTWSLVTPIMGRQANLAKEAAASNGGGKFVTNDRAALGPPGFHPKLATLNLLKESSVNVQGDVVVVHAAVSMMSRSPGPFHFWRLKVTDQATHAVVSDVPYVEQRFQIAASGIMSPTFDEQMQLPPGKYQILLSLYRIPDGVEVRELVNDADKEMAATLIGVSKTIEIP